jgi:putative GTP pyrophosphokinase
MATGKRKCKVEIQLRTMAMDFWASLEHKIKYKYDWEIPQDIKDELYDCSTIVDTLDDKMLALHRRVHNPKEVQVECCL